MLLVFLCCGRLRLMDIQFMKALHKKVNIVPVLAKADSLTRSEIQYMKTRVRKINVKFLLAKKGRC